MVKPISSRRKLFNNKEQFKENEPEAIKSRDRESHSHQIHSHRTYNHNSSSKKVFTEKKTFDRSNSTSPSVFESSDSKKCNFENGVNTLQSRTVMPMSERQQIALVMQLSSPSPTSKSDQSSISTPPTPTTPLFGRGLNKRNERGETPLHLAAIKGDQDKVAHLISQGANVNVADYAGWTALHEACNRGYLVIASLLIQGGADVNAKGLDDDTPLHDACINNHFQIVRLLLIFGAKPDLINSRGNSPFEVCRSPRVLKILEEAQKGKLEKCNPFEKVGQKVNFKELEKSLLEQGFLSINNNCPNSHSSQYSEMSRRTPPNSKPEESTITTESNVSSSVSTSSSVTTSVSASGRPVSPRMAARLPHGSKGHEKTQSSNRSVDSKTAASESEDVYEFRLGKDDSKDADSKPDSSSSKSPQENIPGPVAEPPKPDKRSRESEIEDEEDVKKRRRKEENKDNSKTVRTAALGRPSTAEKVPKSNQRSHSNNGSNNGKQSSAAPTPNTTVSSSSSNSPITVSSSAVPTTVSSEQKKSPAGSASNSPKPAAIGSSKSTEKGDSDNEDSKSDVSTGAPKVPPLKIVLAPFSHEQETHSNNGKNANNRQLPYVVNSSSGDSEEKEGSTSENKEIHANKEETSSNNPGTSANEVTSLTTITTTSVTSLSTTTSGNSTIVSSTTVDTTGNGNGLPGTNCGSSGNDKNSATRITRSQRGAGGSSSSDDQMTSTVKVEVKTEDASLPTSDVLHPRKRKIKMKEPDTEPPVSAPVVESPISNCYEMYHKIRRQVERRRKLLFPVQPKPPQGFKDYLMNRCSYVLANNANSQLSVPLIPAPTTLPQALKDLFSEQEQQRYKLRLQQLIEKEKLVLSVEQEILRVHGRAARALANQVLPFSVCTILKDEEIYNVISPEQEEKDRNARSRYNGRLFLSWLQDVDDKWEKIKEAMVLRHHNEAESLHAVQKMDWEWKLKELGMVEANAKTTIEELHVPMVQVADFDLLPA